MKKIKTYDDLLLAREKHRNKIIRKEFRIRELSSGIRNELTVVNFKNELIQGILERPEIVIKTGMIVYSVVREIRNRR